MGRLDYFGLGDREIEDANREYRIDEDLSIGVVRASDEHKLVAIEGVWNDANVFKQVSAFKSNLFIIRTVDLLNPFPILFVFEILSGKCCLTNGL